MKIQDTLKCASRRTRWRFRLLRLIDTASSSWGHRPRYCRPGPTIAARVGAHCLPKWCGAGEAGAAAPPLCSALPRSLGYTSYTRVQVQFASDRVEGALREPERSESESRRGAMCQAVRTCYGRRPSLSSRSRECLSSSSVRARAYAPSGEASRTR